MPAWNERKLRDLVHELAARAEGAERQAAADGLGQADDVGLDLEVLLGAAPGELGARLHLVEDEQAAELVAQRAQLLQEAVARRHHAHVHHHRLDDDGRDLVLVPLEQGARAAAVSFQVRDQRVLDGQRRDAVAHGQRPSAVRRAPTFARGGFTETSTVSCPPW